MYESAHLISSRTTTQFSEFPMPPGTPDYPGHADLRRYFAAFSDEFDLRRHFRFETAVTSVEPADGGWRVEWSGPDGVGSSVYAGVILANGTLAEPSIPSFPGTFTGELLHSSDYKSARLFEGKRVLIIGAGNSGCDIAGQGWLALGYGSGDAAEAIPMRVATGWQEAARRINFAEALGEPVDLTEAQYVALHEGRASDLIPVPPSGEFVVESVGTIDGADFQNLGVEFYRYVPAGPLPEVRA
jgi:hypothetical protein